MDEETEGRNRQQEIDTSKKPRNEIHTENKVFPQNT